MSTAMRNESFKRVGIAVVLALALHLILAAYVKLPKGRKAAEPVAQPIMVFRIKRVPQAPERHRIARLKAPAARRKPQIVVHARSRTAQGSRARNVRHTAKAARSARKVAVRRDIALPHAKSAPPTAHVATEGTRARGTAQAGGVAQTAGVGNGGEGGRASAGAGTGALGAGAGDGVAPCGTIYITRRGPIKTAGGFERVHVGIQMQLRDGTLSPEIPLPYPLLYRSDDESPFSARNRNNPNFPTLLQFPPDDLDQTSFPDVIKIVLAHTTSAGYTDFGACPRDMKGGEDGPP